MSEYEMTLPVIEAASWLPNPALINVAVKLAVVVKDKTVILEPEVWLNGEIYAGEV